MTPDLSNAHWRKSTRSQNGGNCVEVAPLAEVIAVRDSKNSSGPVLAISTGAWETFISAIRDNLLGQQ